MILQVLFYAELKTFVLKRKFNSKAWPPLKISGCATVATHIHSLCNKFTAARYIIVPKWSANKYYNLLTVLSKAAQVKKIATKITE